MQLSHHRLRPFRTNCPRTDKLEAAAEFNLELNTYVNIPPEAFSL